MRIVITCSSSMAFDRHVSLPDGSMAMAYESASRLAMKSLRAIFVMALPRGTRVLPAYGSIDTRPMIHPSPFSVAAVRS